MKNILSILLFFSLLTAELPVTGQIKPESFIEKNSTTIAAESENQNKESSCDEKETKDGKTESENEKSVSKDQEELLKESLKDFFDDTDQTESKIKDTQNNRIWPSDRKKRENESKKAEEVEAKVQKNKAPTESTSDAQLDLDKDRQLDDAKMELQDKAASGAVLIELEQDKIDKTLLLNDDEMLENKEKKGYHTKVTRKISCNHTTASISGSIKSLPAALALTPTSKELKENIKLTGTLKGKTFTKSVEAYDAGGISNDKVTHLRLNVKINAPGMNEIMLAEPYVCAGDGYAGYSYYEQHFSFCPNNENFYFIGSSHTWLGCTRSGGEQGSNEFRFSPFKHQFNVYKYIPNKYNVVYKANGGTGTVNDQSATYDEGFSLRPGSNFKKTGHFLTGWNTKKDGSGKSYKLREDVINLTAENNATVTLYAQWTPNVLTIRYNANKGLVSGTPKFDILTYNNKWNYGGIAQDPVNISSFGLSRSGYSIKKGAEWNKNAKGTGTSFDQSREYAMTDYAPGLANESQTITLYAQWVPNVYTVTLDRQLANPETKGTEKLYKKYETGIFLDNACNQAVTIEHPIILPQKSGYQFQGYYDSKTAGTQMINNQGQLTIEGKSKKNVVGNETWYAHYSYMITCEDYADIPCDLEKASGDDREDPGVRLAYNSDTKKVTVYTKQSGCSISLTGKPAGTKIGNYQSTISANSAYGNTENTDRADLYLTVLNNTAYQLKITRNGEIICNRLVYYKDGRFRTLAKLGSQDAKEASHGSSMSGSAWNTEDTEYDLYEYYDCSELKDIQEPGTVYRYFHYKDVNMAYSGNGATSGKNTLEYDVSLENFYQFRDNGFEKKKVEKKFTADNKEYICEVKYSFQGWEMPVWSPKAYSEKQQELVSEVYNYAEKSGGISSNTIESIHTYQIVTPVTVLPTLNTFNIQNNIRGIQGTTKQSLYAKANHASEFINFQAKWNAFPTIVLNPGDKLEFFEGEDVTKEKIISHLIAHDNEDNNKNFPNMNDNLRIIKVIYPEPQNRSQGAYEKVYEEDVPEDFLLDTYYLKLEKDETIDVLVTFAVTDSTGNTTEEEFPVTVKYNNYPEIHCDDIFYYRKEEANKGDLTMENFISRASADDEEDGDITWKLNLKDFDPEEFKMQTTSKAEFPITYQVTDLYKKTTYKTVKVIVWDDDASIAEMPKYYVRYISKKHLDTLEKNSIWREPENLAYLKTILNNEIPMESWAFSHEDVLAVQNWITEGGDGHWKIGKQANREFLTKFAHCKQ